jgi:hypothetical protein
VTPLEIAELSSATVIFTWSKLFEGVRAFAPVILECSMCLGFWVGLVGSLVVAWPEDLPHHFLDACAVSVFAYVLTLVFRALGKASE